MSQRLLLVAFLCLMALPAVLRADPSVPAFLGEGSVLQRSATIRYWGFARPGESITVSPSWGGEPASATADDRGRWSVSLTTSADPGPHTITIRGDSTLTIRDILLGELWLASGQSNMEWTLAQSGEPVPTQADPLLRVFDVKNAISLHPLLDVEGRWRSLSPDTAPSISAVALHFARRLRTALNVPVGIITADVGGTRIEAWLPESILQSTPALAAELAALSSLRDPVGRAAVGEQGEARWWRDLDTYGPSPVGRNWASLTFDHTSWKTVELPTTWSADGLNRFDGIIYVVRDITLPEGWEKSPATLDLGPIDDQDEAFVNGTLVGGTRTDGQWGVSRSYPVPAGLLKPGRNLIAIRAYDTAGPGGINGTPQQMRLRSADASLQPIPLAGEWRLRVGPSVAQLPPVPSGVTVNSNSAAVLSNAMIAPLAGHRLAGVLWYQGESNVGNASAYATSFQNLISHWRSTFARNDLPFLFVQIAPYGYRNDRGEAAELRAAQAAALALPHTAMAASIDAGNPGDIHPRDKRTIGERLARLALRDVYAQPGVGNPDPAFDRATFSGNTARVTFTRTRGMRPSATVPNVWIAGADKVFHLASARVEDNTLIASAVGVTNPVAIRYAWDDSAEASESAGLFSIDGDPVAPFRSDAWPLGEWSVDEDSFIAPLRDTSEGFVDLFNGVDLTGWVPINTDASTFSIKPDEKGRPIIHCTGVPVGLLRTERQYENFILELEWRHLEPGGNNGLFIHSDPIPARGVPFTRAIEVQVMDGNEGQGFTSDGDIFHIWGATMKPQNSRGGTARAFPTERRMNPAPRWNHYRVVSLNGEVTLAVNGRIVSRGTDCIPRAGYICLEPEGSPVDFRNIRIKELPPASPPLPPELRAESSKGFSPLYTGVGLPNFNVTPEHEGHWIPRDWTLVFTGNGPDLWTKRAYRDFELIVDWRFTGPVEQKQRPVFLPSGDEAKDDAGNTITRAVPDAGDSGIFLRGNSKSQVNIWCWPVGSGEVWGYRTDAALPPEVRAGVTPRVRADNPPGQWNRFIITMRGDRLTVNLNGQIVIDNAQLPGVPAEGPIGLQRYGFPLEFTNIHIRELPPQP